MSKFVIFPAGLVAAACSSDPTGNGYRLLNPGGPADLVGPKGYLSAIGCTLHPGDPRPGVVVVPIADGKFQALDCGNATRATVRAAIRRFELALRADRHTEWMLAPVGDGDGGSAPPTGYYYGGDAYICIYGNITEEFTQVPDPNNPSGLPALVKTVYWPDDQCAWAGYFEPDGSGGSSSTAAGTTGSGGMGGGGTGGGGTAGETDASILYPITDDSLELSPCASSDPTCWRYPTAVQQAKFRSVRSLYARNSSVITDPTAQRECQEILDALDSYLATMSDPATSRIWVGKDNSPDTGGDDPGPHSGETDSTNTKFHIDPIMLDRADTSIAWSKELLAMLYHETAHLLGKKHPNSRTIDSQYADQKYGSDDYFRYIHSTSNSTACVAT